MSDPHAPGWWTLFVPLGPGYECVLSATAIRDSEVVIVTNAAVYRGRLDFNGQPVFDLVGRL